MSLLVGNGHPGCSAAAERDVGARMLVVFMPQVLLYGVGIVLTGVLQAHRRFLAPAVAPLLSSLVVIAAYVTFAVVAVAPEHGLVHLARAHELVLSIGTTAGVLALVAPLMVPLRATGRRLRPTLHFPPGAAATARRLAIAGAVVLGSQDLATAAVLRLANDRGSDGAVVLVNLAWTVFLLPWAVVAVPVATTAFPELVARWQSGDLMRFAGTAAASARTVLLACAGAAALLVACAAPGARVVVLGAPGHVAPDQLAHAFVAFAPGLIGYGATALLSRVLYARDDVRTPAAATAVGWALAVAVDVALVLAWSRSSAAAAIGVGTSIGTTAAAVLMGLRLRRSAPAALAGVVRSGSAALAAAVTGGAIGVLAAAALPAAGVTTSIAETVVAGVICLATFVAVLWWLDRPTLRLVLGRVAHAR
jgi:putative peptidoglycan lipid II flippase